MNEQETSIFPHLVNVVCMFHPDNKFRGWLRCEGDAVIGVLSWCSGDDGKPQGWRRDVTDASRHSTIPLDAQVHYSGSDSLLAQDVFR